MDQLLFASLSNIHCWYEVGMLKVPATLVCTAKVQASLLVFSLALEIVGEKPGMNLANRDIF